MCVIKRIVIAYRTASKMYCKHKDVLSWVRKTSQESIKYKIISVLSCVFPNEAILAQKILLALLPVRVMSSDLKGDNDHNSVHQIATSPKTSPRHPFLLSSNSNMIKCPIFISYFNCLGVPYIESCLSIIDKHVITFFLGGGINMLIFRLKVSLKCKWEFKFKLTPLTPKVKLLLFFTKFSKSELERLYLHVH